MVKFKNNINRIIITLVVIASIGSCSKEETSPTDTISGQWRCQETTSSKVYIIDIGRSPLATDIYAIYNFNNTDINQSIYASLSSDKLTIDSQFIGQTNISVEGSAVISNENQLITIDYTVTDENGSRLVNCICTRY